MMMWHNVLLEILFIKLTIAISNIYALDWVYRYTPKEYKTTLPINYGANKQLSARRKKSTIWEETRLIAYELHIREELTFDQWDSVTDRWSKLEAGDDGNQYSVEN